VTFTIHQGDAIEKLRELPEASAHCCITSPPYYGLRDYGVEGQIGLEETPEEFLDRLVEVFREVRRVLRDDGTLWVNMGDSYAGSWGAQGRQGKTGELAGRSGNYQRQIAAAAKKSSRTGSIPRESGLKPKDLMGIPWMLAFALRADGWYLRQDIIWHKPNPMPESVRDRCTKAHEYVFLLSKSPRYWYDADAIKERSSENTHPRLPGNKSHEAASAYEAGDERHRTASGLVAYADKMRKLAAPGSGTKNNSSFDAAMAAMPAERNKRSVWSIVSMPTPEAHFATFPLELPELCMKAGCPEGGTVLDPFAGAGTTGLACLKNGRQFVGIELNGDYVTMAYARAMKYYPLLASSCQTQAFPACAD